MQIAQNKLLIAILLTFIAALPRFYNLGELGFHGDEETTSFASRSFAENGRPSMPSGMPYLRAIPQSAANAFFTQFWGVDNELSYRIFSAIAGTLTITALFLSFSSPLGVLTAAIAALLLALSDWHIAISREARMYAPFLLFFLLATSSALRCSVNANGIKWSIAAIALFVCISFQPLGIFATLFIALPYLLEDKEEESAWFALLFMLFVAACSHFIITDFEAAPYEQWKIENATSYDDYIEPTSPKQTILPILFMLQPIYYLAMIIGGLTGAWLAMSSVKRSANIIHVAGCYSLLIGAGILCGFGQIYGAGLLLLCSMLINDNAFEFLKQHWPKLGILSAVLIATMVAVTFQFGYKKLFAFPFPYLLIFIQNYLALTSLCFLTIIYLALTPRARNRQFLRLCALGVVVPLFAVGAVSEWQGLRYLIGIYPFMIILAIAGISLFFSFCLKRINVSSSATQVILLLLVAVSGLITGHGASQAYRAANIQYGDRVPVFNWPYPDHKTAGEYVKLNRQRGDIVVAEDVLEQRWYAGEIDYWLRNSENHIGYVFPVGDNEFEDIYVGSHILNDSTLAKLQSIADRRIWVITSAETANNHSYYLSKSQIAWLKALKQHQKPVYTGKDAITQVFLLNPG